MAYEIDDNLWTLSMLPCKQGLFLAISLIVSAEKGRFLCHLIPEALVLSKTTCGLPQVIVSRKGYNVLSGYLETISAIRC